MGHGQKSKTRSDPKIDILERGEIFFFYRPKVDKEEAHGPDDVQRFYIVLSPESGGERPVQEMQDKNHPPSGKDDSSSSGGGDTTSSSSSTSPKIGKGGSPPSPEGGRGSQEVNIEKQPLLRLIIMGRKSLPHPSKKGRPYWGFVDMVTTRIEDVKTALKREEYDTRTKGHRCKSPARAVGEGIYRILRHYTGKKAHTHLIYKLELPPEGEKNEPQESLNIEREASFLIQIKNPDQQQHGGTSQFRGIQSKRKGAIFPAHLQGLFGKLRYHPADPPDFLNYEGCEFLLISASDDIEEELGLDLGTECESDSCSDLVETFGDTVSITPLLKGIWV